MRKLHGPEQEQNYQEMTRDLETAASTNQLRLVG